MATQPTPILVVKEQRHIVQPIDPFLDFLDILSKRLAESASTTSEVTQVSQLVQRIQKDVRTLRAIYWPMSVGVMAELIAEAAEQPQPAQSA